MNKKIKLYHNPKCSKSREVYNILKEKNIDFEIINYLETPLLPEELKNLYKLLNVDITEFIRINEEEYKIFLEKNSLNDLNSLFIFISKNPKLLQRPILLNGNKAIIGRPPEKILKIL